jgi:nitrous oxidase accessory protein
VRRLGCRRSTRAFVYGLLACGLAASAGALAAGASAQESPTDLQTLIDDADAGEVITLAEGTYRGGVVIDKPITLIGEGWPVVDSGGEGTVFTVLAPDVTIEHLIIRGSGDQLHKEDAGISSELSHRIRIIDTRFEDVLFGVFIRTTNGAEVRDNVIGAKDLFVARRGDGIRLWEATDALVEGNEVRDGRDAIFWFTDRITVRNNQVVGGRYGLHFMYSDGAVVEGNLSEGNSVGAFLMYSTDLVVENNVFRDNNGPGGYGLGLKDMDGIEAMGNRFVDNRVGVYLDNSPSRVDGEHYFHNNVFAYNEAGVLLRPSVERNVFWENAFIDNTIHVTADAGGVIDGNEWQSGGVGNYWSDFAGYDADGDGIGDVPYRVEDVFADLTDRYPEIALFNATPASRAVDMAGRAFPSLRPDPRLVDDAPLVDIPALPELRDLGGDSSRLSLLLVSLLMVGGAALVVAKTLPSGSTLGSNGPRSRGAQP